MSVRPACTATEEHAGVCLFWLGLGLSCGQEPALGMVRGRNQRLKPSYICVIGPDEEGRHVMFATVECFLSCPRAPQQHHRRCDGTCTALPQSHRASPRNIPLASRHVQGHNGGAVHLRDAQDAMRRPPPASPNPVRPAASPPTRQNPLPRHHRWVPCPAAGSDPPGSGAAGPPGCSRAQCPAGSSRPRRSGLWAREKPGAKDACIVSGCQAEYRTIGITSSRWESAA